MKITNIKSTYKEIFQSYDMPALEEHIEKIIELDAYLPYSSTFFCVTNTQNLSFEYISKNMTACIGLDATLLKAEGMRYFWSRIHPEDLDNWLTALKDLMAFTLSEIPLEERNRMTYTWNYRLMNGEGKYVNIVQNTSPLKFDFNDKPIVGLAHYTVLDPKVKLEVSATAKLLNEQNAYETKYFNNYNQKLLADGLSNRERDIVRLLILKYSSKVIAEKLSISPNTVDTHRRNILKKLNVTSTGELIGMMKASKFVI
ncbi:LuxR family transcriptional regulator [Mangrovimonas yunxiaonensis]|uniref:LuxR family transcriptional regulator n=1 Tax=Mangrovimonas yunxiaonensis TaxID=1197477 RepID=A0A084TIR4_9FLAO|nr:helix-turn-helix transcriptional regulator [Mangrovimonas yunxiaonensis]KFB00600.1 LuxR family transcriptional regulator [Mangrovimonas yunxiaonensis]GGH46912.1 helix-turn-helix transcriptional regulator [Mangrovimonas yunxiaonensis]